MITKNQRLALRKSQRLAYFIRIYAKLYSQATHGSLANSERHAMAATLENLRELIKVNLPDSVIKAYEDGDVYATHRNNLWIFWENRTQFVRYALETKAKAYKFERFADSELTAYSRAFQTPERVLQLYWEHFPAKRPVVKFAPN